MAKIKGGIGALLSGKLEGVVFVQRGEQSFLRTEPDYSRKKWTPAQEMHRERFRKVSAFCMQFRHSVIRPIWNLIPGKATGYGRFLSANMQAFDGNGNLADLAKLHFSEGTLPLPNRMNVELAGGNPAVAAASWENDPSLQPQHYTDELRAVFASGGKFIGPVNIGAKRADLHASLELPSAGGKAEAVYLFFASKDMQAYSPDQYFAV
jgi:hypothetical protein